jgi:protein SCO1
MVSLMACARGPEPQRYEVRGQVVAVDRERREITIRHDAIENFMPAMTMPFRVPRASVLDGRVPGDLVSGTLEISPAGTYLTNLRTIGFADLVEPSAAPAAASGFELLEPGQPVPDEAFLDQHGRPRRLSEGRGQVTVLTFIFTRCPIPTFCPMMDRHFAALRELIESDPRLRGRVQLYSISFDPEYDTPDVLRSHANRVGADGRRWTFLTGERDDVDRFASRFGVSILRDEADARDITHNLRTAVIDTEGRLVKVYRGTDWTPGEVLADLTAVAPGS